MNLEHLLAPMVLFIARMLAIIQHFCPHQELMTEYVIAVMGRMNMNLILSVSILARSLEQLLEKKLNESMSHLSYIL